MVDLEKYELSQNEFDMLVAIKTGNAFNYLCSDGHHFSVYQILDIAKEIAIEVDNYVEKCSDLNVDSIVEEILQRWVDAEYLEEVAELVEKEAQKQKEEVRKSK